MSSLLNILIITTKVIDIGKNTQRRSSILLITQRNDASLSLFLDPPLAWRFAFKLSNNSCLRIHQCFLHASSHHLPLVFLHLLLGEAYHLARLDKALALLYLYPFMSNYFL